MVLESKELRKPYQETGLLYWECGTPGSTWERQALQEKPENRLQRYVRATLPGALNVINASSVGKLVQLVTASRLTLYHEG